MTAKRTEGSLICKPRNSCDSREVEKDKNLLSRIYDVLDQINIRKFGHWLGAVQQTQAILGFHSSAGIESSLALVRQPKYTRKRAHTLPLAAAHGPLLLRVTLRLP